MSVGKRIRELREANDYTREAFAEMIDISAKFLYEIEMGKKGFSAELLCRMSEVLSVSCDYIMYGEVKTDSCSHSVYDALISLNPAQISKIRNMLVVLSDVYSSVNN